MARPMAIYDLDRTVTCRPTYSLFLLSTGWRLAPLRLLLVPLLALLWLFHKLGFYARDRLKVLMWAVVLGPADAAGIEQAASLFAVRTLTGNIRPGALAQIERDRADGALLVLATAAHELYAAPIAAGLGFHAVVATRLLSRADGRIGPELDGANLYGKSKLVAMRRFRTGGRAEGACAPLAFYSDSSSDLPVFDWVDRAIAVNPSRRLARIAGERSWPIVDWERP